MDRSWMFTNRTTDAFEIGVNDFLRQAIAHAIVGNRIYCPCLKCGNKALYNVHEVKGHIFFNGFDNIRLICFTNIIIFFSMKATLGPCIIGAKTL